MIGMSVLPAFAATGVTLVNSGLGQRASDTANFGLAVCNVGTQDATQAASVVVTANGKTVTLSSPVLAVGVCGYVYTSYAGLGMTAGNTYSVSVVIDPNQTVSATNSATYSVTVPAGQVLGASTMSTSARQQMLAQLANLEAMLQALLSKLH